MTRLLLCLAWLFASTVVVPILDAHALQPDEILADASLEKRARALSTGLRCLVCQNQSIDESDAPLARDLRLLVRERLTAGDSDGQVIDFVVARYGEFVLLKPRFGAHTLVLWLLPLLLLVLALAFLWRRLQTADSPPDTAVGRNALSPDEEMRLAELLEQDRASVSKD